MKRKLLIVSLVLLSFSIKAQQQFTGWLASFNTYKLNSKTSVHFDAQIRGTDEFQNIQTVLIRPGLNIRLSKKITGSFGYAFIQNRRVINTTAGTAVEHRPWQQLLLTEKIANITSSHRLRLEQRFIPVSKVLNGELRFDGNKFANRIRYFSRNVIPLKKGPVFSNGFFVGIQNEIFLNIGNTSAVNGKTFDQNRLFLSTGYRLNSILDLEIGYMNQYISGKVNSFTNNHIIQLGAYTRF